jgi:cleavage and polyadenylation specificity factor subunit 1
MGTVLQQRVNNAWQPLAFFSRKLNRAQQKYSAYDRELLAVYDAVKNFRHMLEARHFVIFPITSQSHTPSDRSGTIAHHGSLTTSTSSHNSPRA